MLAWAPSVDCSKSCHARSTSRRIAYEGNLWPAERDLQDVCSRQCSSSTGYTEGSSRAENLPQLAYCISESRETKFENKADNKRIVRYQADRSEENQIRNTDQDTSRTFEDSQAAVHVSRELRSSAAGSLTPSEAQLGADVSRYRTQKVLVHTLRNHRYSNTCDYSGSAKITSPEKSLLISTNQRRDVESDAVVEATISGRLRLAEEASEQVSGSSSVEKVPQLAERRSVSREFVVEALDDSGSARNVSGGPENFRVNPWNEKVGLVGHDHFLLGEDLVECSTDVGGDESDDFGFHDVIDSQASHGNSHELRGEKADKRSQKDYRATRNLEGDRERSKTANAIPGGSKCPGLTERGSRGGIRDVLVVDSLPQPSVSDKVARTNVSEQPQRQGSPAQISLSKPLIGNSAGDRDLEEIQAKATTAGRRYPERIGSLGVITISTTGLPNNSERAGDAVIVAAGAQKIGERIGGTSEGPAVRERIGILESPLTRERVGGSYRADSHLAQEGSGGSAESLKIRETIGGSSFEGHKIPERIGAGPERDSPGKVQEKGKDEKLHSREEGHHRQSDILEERRIRARMEVSGGSAGGGGDDMEEPKVIRPARPSGGKDRHSKVNTAKGPRDRRVRLSVPTAVQFYDVQDRLGFDQPSKAVEWLINKAKDAIDELARVPVEGKEGPRVPGVSMGDSTHHVPATSSYVGAVSGHVSGTSSCTPANQTPLNNPYGNHLSFLMGSPIGRFSPPQPSQGHFAGSPFGLGQIDLTRGNTGSTEGGRSSETAGSPLARVESRTKARERARERFTKKVPGRDGGQASVTSGGSPSSSSQSPPFHPNSTFSSFSPSNSMQGSAHSLSLQGTHQNPTQISNVYESTAFSRIIQSSHQTGPGAFQTLIMQNSLDSHDQYNDQIQNSLQSAFMIQSQATLHSPPRNISSLQLQHPHLQTLQVNNQGALHVGSNFNPGPCSSAFPEASVTSPHYLSISGQSISQSLSVPHEHLPVLGITPAVALGTHYPTGSPTPIPPGFSPGPPASAFRAHRNPLSMTQCSNQNQQQQLQGLPRGQRALSSFAATSGVGVPSTSLAGSSSSRASAFPYYSDSPNSLIDCLHAMSSERLSSPSFTSRRSAGFDPGTRGRPMMSPSRNNSHQASNSQIPARIQGLDEMEDLEEEMNPATPSSPHT